LDSSTRTVLVVDSDPTARELLTRLFQRVGYRVREASAGDQALAQAQREQPELAILDVGLPGISGYELCRELKDRFGPELPVVLVSAERTEPFDRVGGLLIGADDYIVKPFDSDEVLARVRRLLDRPPTPKQRRRRTDSDANVGSLTGRELQVLRLLAEGVGQPAIARELVITPKTVSTHIRFDERGETPVRRLSARAAALSYSTKAIARAAEKSSYRCDVTSSSTMISATVRASGSMPSMRHSWIVRSTRR
jgi:DNA-binding response OmpR family regulator